MSEHAERHISDGQKITAKLKRGTGTRDQDVIKITARAETWPEVVRNFEQMIAEAEGGEWAKQLRELQAQEGDDD